MNNNYNEYNSGIYANTQSGNACPKCGNVLTYKTTNYCTSCGCSLVGNEVNSDAKSIKKASAVLFVLSGMNLFILAPYVGQFLLLWLLFGALGESVLTYYTIIAGGCGYLLASVVAFIAFLFNLSKSNLKKCFLSILMGFIIGILGAFILFVI